MNTIKKKKITSKKITKKTNPLWEKTITLTNLKKRAKRNLFSILGLSISLLAALLSIGFIYGKDDSINEASVKRLDYGVGTISKEEKVSSGSLLSLTRTERPKYEEVKKEIFIEQNFHICLNFDTLLPANPEIKYDDEVVEGLYLSPIYSFSNIREEKCALLTGKKPKIDTLDEVVINNTAYDLLKKKLHKEIVNESLLISYEIETTYIDFDETYVTDYFRFSRLMNIKAIYQETSYLQTPSIYYSYVALENFLKESLLVNLSTYFNYDTSWFDRISNVDSVDYLSSYSYRLFPKKDVEDSLLFNLPSFREKLSFTSPSLLARNALLGFMEAAEYGLLLFLVITLVGTSLILGIISLANYSEDHKKSAILTALGAREEEITNIYLSESLITAVIAIVIALGLSFPIEKLINTLIYKYIDLSNFLVIPYLKFLNVPFLLPLLVIVFSLLLCSLTTIIPIKFSKRISLKEELQSL